MIILRTNRKIERYRGTVLIETAIAIVLLLMFTLGIIGFGYLFLRAQEITIAARHGARLACVYNADSLAVVGGKIDAYLDTQGLTHSLTAITYDSANNTVKATVIGTQLDILNLGNISFMGKTGWFPNTFTASVTMAKEK